MSINTEQTQLKLIISHLCDYLGGLMSAKGQQSAQLRRQIGDLRSRGLYYLDDEIFGTKLWSCFVTARTLPITYDRVAFVRQEIYTEKPTGPLANLMVDTSILYCLTTESILITQAAFDNYNQTQELITRMRTAFDDARERAADRMDSATYQNLNYLAGSLVNHLVMTGLTLPRIVTMSFQASMPSLYLANRLYQDASRSDELIWENDAVHPLFMPRDIGGLSA